MTDHQVPEQVWQVMKERLDYSDEELSLFKKDPRNAAVLAAASQMTTKTILFEVVESHGCNCQHRVGTRFFFTGEGQMLTKMAPSRVCPFAIVATTHAIFAMQELWYAGVDPDALCFKRSGCGDVGVRCGGWGHIVLEATVLDREEAKKLHADPQSAG